MDRPDSNLNSSVSFIALLRYRRVLEVIWRIYLAALCLLVICATVKIVTDVPLEKEAQRRMKRDALRGRHWVDHTDLVDMDIGLALDFLICAGPPCLALTALRANSGRRLAATHASCCVSPAIDSLHLWTRGYFNRVASDLSIGLQQINRGDAYLLPKRQRLRLRRILLNYSLRGDRALASRDFVLNTIHALSEVGDTGSIASISAVMKTRHDPELQAAAADAIDKLNSCSETGSLLRESDYGAVDELVRGSQESACQQKEALRHE